jgi:hypothetical protein
MREGLTRTNTSPSMRPISPSGTRSSATGDDAGAEHKNGCGGLRDVQSRAG